MGTDEGECFSGISRRKLFFLAGLFPFMGIKSSGQGERQGRLQLDDFRIEALDGLEDLENRTDTGGEPHEKTLLKPGKITARMKATAARYVEAASSLEELDAMLEKCGCDPERLVLSLRPRPDGSVKPGYYEAEHFKTGELSRKYPDELLYFVVPESYTPEKPTGLIVFMHGGGLKSPATAPARYMRMGDKTGFGLGDAFYKSGMVAVGPSALKRKTSVRWCVPDSDDYIRDVILECEARFNIDPNRVVLMGYSMGGFGAMHHVQRQPDRFAAVLAGAGAWNLAFWPVITGTPLWIVHGSRDAVFGKRGHDTDVQFARLAHEALSREGIEHEYLEFDGGHDPRDAHESLVKFIARMRHLRRDPYHPRVVCVTPRGWTIKMKYPARHNRWITIRETLPGKIAYDRLINVRPKIKYRTKKEKWDAWKLALVRREYPGALVDAVNLGNNVFKVEARNVKRFTLWLHQKMVDFKKPVRVVVNGREAYEALVSPSVTTALLSFARRRDWGLIYPARIEITVPR